MTKGWSSTPYQSTTWLVYASPSHQYPLGLTMSLRRRMALAAWADTTGAAIIEDDYDSEFRFGDRPIEPVKTLDGGGSGHLRGDRSRRRCCRPCASDTWIVPRSIGHAHRGRQIPPRLAYPDGHPTWRWLGSSQAVPSLDISGACVPRTRRDIAGSSTPLTPRLRRTPRSCHRLSACTSQPSRRTGPSSRSMPSMAGPSPSAWTSSPSPDSPLAMFHRPGWSSATVPSRSTGSTRAWDGFARPSIATDPTRNPSKARLGIGPPRPSSDWTGDWVACATPPPMGPFRSALVAGDADRRRRPIDDGSIETLESYEPARSIGGPI